MTWREGKHFTSRALQAASIFLAKIIHGVGDPQYLGAVLSIYAAIVFAPKISIGARLEVDQRLLGKRASGVAWT